MIAARTPVDSVAEFMPVIAAVVGSPIKNIIVKLISKFINPRRMHEGYGSCACVKGGWARL